MTGVDSTIFRLPGVLLGVGLGGFIDGIVLHQLLQWHHMLTATGDHPSTTVVGLEDNTVADGLFHVGSWIFVMAGTVLLYRSWKQGRPAPAPAQQLGLLLTGWALFNLVEGVVNHHVLGLHNVRDDVADPTWWNLSFLAASAVLLAIGLLLARRRPAGRDRRSPTRRGQPVGDLAASAAPRG